MAINFCCCSFIILKIVDFKVDNNALWNCTIFIIFFLGGGGGGGGGVGGAFKSL